MMKAPVLKNIDGLSLIELLVAMVLGLTLALGVVQIYVGTTATERGCGGAPAYAGKWSLCPELSRQ